MVIILYLWYIQNGAPKLLLMAQPLKHPQSESGLWCLEMTDVGCNLKQFDGTTWLSLIPVFCDTAPLPRHSTICWCDTSLDDDDDDDDDYVLSRLWVTYARVKFNWIPPDPISDTFVLEFGVSVWWSDTYKLWDQLEFCRAMSPLVISLITTVTSMHLTLFHFIMWLLSFLVTERCGDVHKLVVVRICTRRRS